MPAETRAHRLPTAVLALIVPVLTLIVAVFTLDVASSHSNSTATRGAGNATSIVIEDFNFSPKPVRVKAGTTVTVTNADDTDHTVTAADGAFDTGALGGGEQATITIDRPGTYRYFCDIHNYMTGTIEAS